jgi:hypothetical protein
VRARRPRWRRRCGRCARARARSGPTRIRQRALLFRFALCAGFAREVVGEGEVEQALDARPQAAGALERHDGRLAVHEAQAQAPDALPRVGVLRAARGGAVGRLGGEVDRAHVLVDARGEAMRRGTLALDARPVAHGSAGRTELAGLPEGQRHEAQDGRVAGLGVARVDQALGGQRVIALGHRVLGGGHEALHALGPGVGLGEVDELQGAGGDRPHAGRELHARPLLDVVAAAGEVDARDRADAPLRVAQAARVAVHHRVVGHARAEGVVLGPVGGVLAGALLGLVGAPALLGPGLARGRRGDLDRVARHAPAARALGQRDELIGRVVDRLQMAFVLELAPWRRQVGVPDLGQPAARELNVALVEGRLDLQEEERLLDVEHCGHEHPTIAPSGPTGRGPGAAVHRPPRAQ